MKTVLFVLLDQFADWESAFLAPALRGGIMPGRPGSHAERYATPEAERIVPLVREALSHGILVGAICNAASFLAAHGFLNGVRHTGNGLEMLREWGGANYTGEKLYQERQAVRDGNVVTANGSG